MADAPSAAYQTSPNHGLSSSQDGRSVNSRPDTRPSTTYDPLASETTQDPQIDSKSTTGKRAKRKKKHRKRRNRRQSFISAEDPHAGAPTTPGPEVEHMAMMADQTKSRGALPFYKLGRDLSSTSLESEALLDHRYVVSSVLLSMLVLSLTQARDCPGINP